MKRTEAKVIWPILKKVCEEGYTCAAHSITGILPSRWEVVKAFSEGAVIEFRDLYDGDWGADPADKPDDELEFSDFHEYRVKPREPHKVFRLDYRDKSYRYTDNEDAAQADLVHFTGSRLTVYQEVL